jgi:hypothetical protein
MLVITGPRKRQKTKDKSNYIDVKEDGDVLMMAQSM